MAPPPGLPKSSHDEPLSAVSHGVRWAIGGTVALVVLSCAVALYIASNIWSLESLAENEHGFASGQAPWFLWGSPHDGAVARSPGGTPIPGKWTIANSGNGSPVLRSGRPDRGAMSDSDVGGRWRGLATGRGREHESVEWLEFVRDARAADFAELGHASDLAGRWRSCFDEAPGLLDLLPDGEVHDESGEPRGHWAGDDRLLLVYFPGWQRTRVHRFLREVRLDPGDGTEREVFEEQDGCLVFELHREP